MTSVSISRVAKSYGDAHVLSSFDVEINDGTFFTLLGPSGCGKTTLLRIVAGFVRPDAGTVRFGDEDVTRMPPHKRNVGMVFQDYALFPDKSVFTNVAYGLHARSVPASEIKTRVNQHLEMVGLSALGDRYPSELSGGQRQRVALARALVISPRVLLMDEPLSNLDAKLRVQMREMIRDLQQKANITTIFVTHDQEEALVMSDKVAVMERGHVEQIGSPREIYATPRSAYVADFVGAANLLPATIKETAGSRRVVCDVLSQAVSGRYSGDKTTGDLALVLRPEQVRLEAGKSAPGSDANVLRGVVTRHQYLGFKVSYSVALADGLEIRVDSAATSRAEELDVGANVNVLLGNNPLFVDPRR